ncbi:MAG: PilT protein domain protein [Parcubacteria group bacterium Gr01-1014_33]|nr:MAG: PilT protein domain protein [Parcubacteria group bacterium Gr01-1014_33]
MYVIDTNILIYDAAGDVKVGEFLNTRRHEIFYLPTIVIVEFLAYPLITKDTIEKFRLFTSQTILINLDSVIAERAGEMRKNYKLKLADAIIAASALTTRSTLLTRNIKDFRRVRDLSIISP